jgi:hypothetical protein
MPREIEAKMVVVGADPEAILERVSGLESLGPYLMSPGGSGTLEDTYYDTPARSLSAKACALRTRRSGQETFLCIKMDEHASGDGMTDREEIELAWSVQGLRRIEGFMSDLGNMCGRWEGLFERCTEREILAALGLYPIQHRRTSRRVLAARLKGSGAACAVLCLDRVAYETDRGVVLHREIEVEASPGGDAAHVREIAGSLVQCMGDALMPWPYNKLLTGAALEVLAERRMLDTGRTTLGLTRRDYEESAAIIGGLTHGSPAASETF